MFKSLGPLLLLALPAAGAEAPFSPSPLLDFRRAPEAISRHCADAKRQAETALAVLAAIPEAQRTFANTPAALEFALNDVNDQAASEILLKDVAVSSAVRQAGAACATLIEKFGVEVFSREDLYKAVRAYQTKKEALAGEDKRLLEKELLDFKRSGLMLAPEKREEVKRLRQRIVELQEKYKENLGEVKDSLLVTREELAGLPDDYIQRLEKQDGKYRVTLDYPDYFPFMENAKNADARRRLEFLFNNRAAKENLPLFKEILELRDKAARLLGYANHAAFVLEDRMAKNPEAVDRFLARLDNKLKPLARRELAVLVGLKNREEGKASDGVIHPWDWRYYDNLLKKTRYQVDAEKIKEYFPMDTVTEGMLAVYQKLLGVRFRRIENAAVWHPDVSLYEIADASGGPALAYFYMDLFPRDGKYKHAASFPIINGRLLPDGGYQKPVAAIVANFNKPSAGRPSLLKHGEGEEVETFFHEFGHIMHQTLTKARYERFSGSSVAQDFVEAPSQMLENWVWNPEVLASLSGYYQDRAQKLPPELLNKMLAAKHVNSGLVNLRQILFGSVDMSYHSAPGKDTTAVWNALQARISMIPMTPGTHPEASFGHLVDGYDAGYYGYLWSKVYAQDMFSRFEAAGVLDSDLGREYRRDILEPGSSREETASLRAFLGREPNEEAFLKSLGLGEDHAAVR